MRIEQVVNCGGIAEKNPLVMQIYADVTGRPMKVSRSAQTCALGAAVAAAVVAGAHRDFAAAIGAMTGLKPRVFKPDAGAHAVYRELVFALRAVARRLWQGAMARQPASGDETTHRPAQSRARVRPAHVLDSLKRAVCQANLDLVREGLVVQTWGNASGLDRERGLVVIKPSGVPYTALKPAQMVVVRLDNGKVAEGKFKPSSDTADASGVVPRLGQHRRGGPYAQPARHRMGAGLPAHPGPGHDARRLLSRGSSAARGR